MSFQDRTIIISVEGNIGSGKTLLLRELARNAKINVVFEPEQMWRGLKKRYNLLAQFYNDRARWTYSFQTVSFIARTQTLIKARLSAMNVPLVSERSVFSDRYCFARASRSLGNMSDIEWHAYVQWFDWLASTYAIIPDGFIYLRSDPEYCLQKIKRSQRTEERVVTKHYLDVLHECHESWLLSEVMVGACIAKRPCLVVEAIQLQDISSSLVCNAVNEFIHSLESKKVDKEMCDTKNMCT